MGAPVPLLGKDSRVVAAVRHGKEHMITPQGNHNAGETEVDGPFEANCRAAFASADIGCTGKINHNQLSVIISSGVLDISLTESEISSHFGVDPITYPEFIRSVKNVLVSEIRRHSLAYSRRASMASIRNVGTGTAGVGGSDLPSGNVPSLSNDDRTESHPAVQENLWACVPSGDDFKLQQNDSHYETASPLALHTMDINTSSIAEHETARSNLRDHVYETASPIQSKRNVSLSERSGTGYENYESSIVYDVASSNMGKSDPWAAVPTGTPVRERRGPQAMTPKTPLGRARYSGNIGTYSPVEQYSPFPMPATMRNHRNVPS